MPSLVVKPCIAGRAYLLEQFAGLEFQVRSDTFFKFIQRQLRLYCGIMQQLNLQGDEVLVDAYCGIGTLTLPLAEVLRQAVGLEVQPEAVEQAQVKRNGITNVTFQVGAVEKLLPQLGITPDIVLLDPPRKGAIAL